MALILVLFRETYTRTHKDRCGVEHEEFIEDAIAGCLKKELIKEIGIAGWSNICLELC